MCSNDSHAERTENGRASGQRTGSTQSRENPPVTAAWQIESSHVTRARGILQSIVEKMEASQTIQQVMTLYFK